MSPMRTHKTKRGAERAEEPQEPVQATESAPADHTATDALLDTIEELLDAATVEEVEAEPKPWEKFTFAEMMGDETIEWMPTTMREALQQVKFYEEFIAEREQTPVPDDIPWEDIAKLPPPGPGGTTVEFYEPEEIDYSAGPDDNPMVIKVPYRTRVLHVTRAMWEEARRGMGPARGTRYRGDDGMCPKCGWPKAGPGRFPCGTDRRDIDTRAWNYGVYMPPPDPCKIVNITGV